MRYIKRLRPAQYLNKTKTKLWDITKCILRQSVLYNTHMSDGKLSSYEEHAHEQMTYLEH